MYICDTQTLEMALPTLLASPVLAIDTEFMRERTYYARLCLVQIATEAEVFVLDAISLGEGIRLLSGLLTAPHSVKVFHAGSQDIEILLRATGVTPSPVFDTQIAATLAGFPTQVGYAQLAKDLAGVEIDKADTFSDWSARPLSEAQLRYAGEDVRHLITIHTLLRDRLQADGRLEWLAEDFERLADPETYAASPEEQYRRVKRASTLDRRSLAVLREVAAWREVEAQKRDIPKRWLISDESLVEIARRRVKTVDELRAIRGVNDRVASRAGSGLIEAVLAGEAVPEGELPQLPKRSRVPRDAQPLADMLNAVVRIRAREHGVAPALLGSREELERFAGGEREGHPLSSGWRHTLVGAELEAILEGRVSIRVEDGKLVLSPVEAVSREHP
ncbi:MAG: ribonuclease D [Coriobacteriia bacterium]|nr:ribonuclease D [Coriobacteriia bacterium]